MTRTTRTFALLAFLLAMTPTAAHAEDPAASPYAARLDAEFVPSGLTASDVAARTVTISPELAAKKQDLIEAAAQVDQALAAYIPSLTVKANYTRLSDAGSEPLGNVLVAPGAPAGPVPPGTQLVNAPLELATISNQYALEANLLVPVSDYFLRVAPSHSAARAQYASSQKSFAAQKAAVAADARVSYYTWVRSRLSEVVAEHALVLSQSHLTDVKQAYAAGTASRADVLRVESQLASSEDYLATSRNMTAIAEDNLRILTKASPSEAFQIGEDVRRRIPVAPHESAGTLVNEALGKRPELTAYDQAHRAQSERASVERAGMLPRLDLFANAAYANPNSRVFPQTEEFRGTWEAGAQLAWTVSDVPGAHAGARAADARAEALLAERRALADQIQSEVFSAHRTLLPELGTVKTSARRLVAAEESYRVRRLLFQTGKATSVELMDAEVELTRARLEALNARVDARVAQVRLNYALGRTQPQARRASNQGALKSNSDRN